MVVPISTTGPNGHFLLPKEKRANRESRASKVRKGNRELQDRPVLLVQPEQMVCQSFGSGVLNPNLNLQ